MAISEFVLYNLVHQRNLSYILGSAVLSYSTDWFVAITISEGETIKRILGGDLELGCFRENEELPASLQSQGTSRNILTVDCILAKGWMIGAILKMADQFEQIV